MKCFGCNRDVLEGYGLCENGCGKSYIPSDPHTIASLRNRRCHHGLVCVMPSHIATLLDRYNPPWYADAFEHEVKEWLMLEDEQTYDTPIAPASFDHATITELDLPQERDGSFIQPLDFQEQFRRSRLRAVEACPFRLRCENPQAAINLVWDQLYMLKDYKLEIEEHHWQPLVNIFEVMGMDWEAHKVREKFNAIHAEYKKRQTSGNG